MKMKDLIGLIDARKLSRVGLSERSELEHLLNQNPPPPKRTVGIIWEPYMLNVDTPKEGYDLKTYIDSKYGPGSYLRFNVPGNHLEQAGSKVGIRFNSSRRIINTLDAHRLMEWCNSSCPDKADAFMECLFNDYFVEAKDLSNSELLLETASRAGLSKVESSALLASTQLKDDVLRKDNNAKRKLRVNGVPFFIIEKDGEIVETLSGAQPPEVLAELIGPLL